VQPQIAEPIVLTAATLVGDQLYERDGEPLGEIKDVAFDLQQGCIAYLIVSVGGLLGIGSKFFAVPWRAVNYGDDELLSIDMSAGQLSAAPSFPKDSWPDMSDRQWGAEVHTYFNCTPYWQ
jgi:sporulation protein YlmC with PRC-barrel domain